MIEKNRFEYTVIYLSLGQELLPFLAIVTPCLIRLPNTRVQLICNLTISDRKVPS